MKRKRTNLLNIKTWLEKSRLMCGVMTGTSLDGVDVALARFSENESGGHAFEILHFDTLEYPTELKSQAMGIISGIAGIREISQFHYALSYLYADAIREVCKSSGILPESIDAVGIHGQTVWHEPKPAKSHRYNVPSTLQIGSVSTLAQLLGVPVVGDFRAADIALGGEGAPLVPIFDYEFLSSNNENVIALNIGGMANITVMPAGCKKEDVHAFDTGPGNVLIDLAMKEYFGKNYDKNGDTARSGSVIPDLMNALKKIGFISKQPPKSTGRELFNSDLMTNYNNYIKANEPKENVVRTLTDFTAWSIAENIRQFAEPSSKLVVSGGGSCNTFLMELLRKELPEAKIIISDEEGIPSDAKEALCFGYLAYLTLGGLPGNMPSVTGASREAVLGVVAHKC